MKLLLSFFIAFISHSLWPQNQEVENRFSKDSLRFFIVNENVQLIFNNSVVRLQGDKFYKSSLYLDQKDAFNFELNQNNFQIINGDLNETYLVRQSLGEVFKLKNDSILRNDQSSDLRSHSGSIKYFYNNEIYSFFGYGYFDTSNQVIVYSEENNEWHKISHPLDSDIPLSRRSPFSNKYNNKAYFFNGTSNGKTVNDAYEYDFTNATFSKIGQVSDDFPYADFISPQNILQLYDFKKIYQIGFDLLLVDFENFTFSSQAGLISVDLSISDAHHLRDQIVFLKKINGNVFYVENINTSYVLESFKNYLPILESTHYSKKSILYLFILIFILTIAILLFRFLKLRTLKRNTVLKQSNYLTYKNELIILTPSESDILDYLIQNNNVLLSELYTLGSFAEYSDFYKKQLISKTFEELNEKIIQSKVLASKLNIEKKTNKLDKRTLTISLKGNIILYRGWLRFVLNL